MIKTKYYYTDSDFEWLGENIKYFKRQQILEKLYVNEFEYKPSFKQNQQQIYNIAKKLRTNKTQNNINERLTKITTSTMKTLKDELIEYLKFRLSLPALYLQKEVESYEVETLIKQYLKVEEELNQKLTTAKTEYEKMKMRNDAANKFMGSFNIFLKNRYFFGKKRFTDSGNYAKHYLAGKLRKGKNLEFRDVVNK
ncbi:MAG: hypothetical protein FWC41_02140 [Firmicutes bacterium]|nr:hypothetical protein [Bacillota bacterium]